MTDSDLGSEKWMLQEHSNDFSMNVKGFQRINVSNNFLSKHSVRVKFSTGGEENLAPGEYHTTEAFGKSVTVSIAPSFPGERNATGLVAFGV